MTFTRSRSTGLFGAGLVTGVAAAAGVVLGRRAATPATIGHGHAARHRTLDAASGVMQPKYPLDAMGTYLNGFHMYADDTGRQVEASHFCIHLRPELHQCVIFDRNSSDARLIGIEYIVTEERFRELPDAEKQLWHSHHYEVKSGVLVAPGVPDLAEKAYFTDLVTTYGKTFHTWQYDRDDFPYGAPQLMMAMTGDGQARTDLVDARDDRIGVSTEAKRTSRSDIPTPDVVPGANRWESGRTPQTRLTEVEVRR